MVSACCARQAARVLYFNSGCPDEESNTCKSNLAICPVRGSELRQKPEIWDPSRPCCPQAGLPGSGLGVGPKATFYGGPAPDTLLLLPGRTKRFVDVDRAERWGFIELAPSQQRREGGGWRWWLVGDTLNIRADNPTMDGIAIWSVRPDGNSRGMWRVFGLGLAETGRVVLVPYKCTSLPAADPSNRTAAPPLVPAEAPDTIPAWVRADSNLTGPSTSIPVRFRKNLLIVQFHREASQLDRQAAVDLVRGTVVGGDGSIYLVRVTDPGDGSELVKAGKQLQALLRVLAASPDLEMGQNRGTTAGPK